LQTENYVIWHRHTLTWQGSHIFRLSITHTAKSSHSPSFTITLVSQAPTHKPWEGIHHSRSTQAPFITHISIYIHIFT